MSKKSTLNMKILRKVRAAATQVGTEAWKQAKASEGTGFYL